MSRALALALLIVACGHGAATNKEPLVADAPGNEMTADEVTAEGGAPDAGGAEALPSSDGAQQGNEEGAQTLLKQFVAPDADHAALTKSLRPSTIDYKAMFDPSTAPKVEAAQAKDWDSNKAVIKPKPNQTEVKLWSATGAELASGTGNAKEFPAGYKKVAKHLSPTVLFFRFKFVEAGKDQGTAYDGLAFVNGRWVIAPKPWKAIGGGKGGDKDDGEEGAEAAPGKPKPKPKKPKKKK
jgi:hypothetical protein